MLVGNVRTPDYLSLRRVYVRIFVLDDVSSSILPFQGVKTLCWVRTPPMNRVLTIVDIEFTPMMQTCTCALSCSFLIDFHGPNIPLLDLLSHYTGRQ